MPWRRGAVAEGAADALASELSRREDVGWKLGIAEHHASQPNQVGPAVANHGLGDVRQIFLKIGVACADDRHLGHGGLDLPRYVNLPRYTDEGIFGRLISVARWKGGRTLNVRIVIGAASETFTAATPSTANSRTS